MPLMSGTSVSLITRSKCEALRDVPRALGAVGQRDVPARAQQEIERAAKLRIRLDHENARRALVEAQHVGNLDPFVDGGNSDGL